MARRPWKARQRMHSANTEPPTLLTTRSTPLPPVAFMTASWKSGFLVSMPASRPRAFSFLSFSLDPEVPMTFAPIAFAACKAATPTPADTPVTSSHSPAFRPPCATSMSCTTMKVSGIAPASSQERFGGTGMASVLSMSPNSAKPPGQRPITRSPEPTTSPAASCPAGLAAPAAMRPWPAMSSPRFRLEARILTRCWCAAGSGAGTSRSSRFILSPTLCRKYALMSPPGKEAKTGTDHDLFQGRENRGPSLIRSSRFICSPAACGQ